jgi:hypothetical protein
MTLSLAAFAGIRLEHAFAMYPRANSLAVIPG